jgi:acetoin utilization deacetylase AcuC-like enzyme
VGVPVLFHHDSSLLHDNGPHPESARRITTLLEELEVHDWLGMERRESPAATRAQIEAVHDELLVMTIERVCAAGGGALDADTIVSKDSFEAALRGSGGAIAMVDGLVAGEFMFGAAVHRPPGHHAERGRAMGFCLFDHIAVAAHHAVATHGLKRVAILDFDVHHGNGTQDIFWERSDVHFCSIHQWPFYPGSGAESERGVGDGRGFTVNLPVAAGAGDAEFLAAVQDTWATAMQAYEPQLILLSAGFDAHKDDPLASCLVTDDGFAAIGAGVRVVAAELGVPVGLVLEGGYDVQALARSFVRVSAELTALS